VRPPDKALQKQGFFICIKSSDMHFLTFRYDFLRFDAPKIRPVDFNKLGIIVPFSAFLHSLIQQTEKDV